MKYLLLILLFPFCATAAEIPHTFFNGEPADANKVNENFQALADNIETLTTFKVVHLTSSDGFLVSTCPANHSAVSVSCECTGKLSNNTNYGNLYACILVSENGFGGACALVPALYVPDYPVSPITVNAMCVENRVTILSKPKPDSSLLEETKQRFMDRNAMYESLLNN